MSFILLGAIIFPTAVFANEAVESDNYDSNNIEDVLLVQDNLEDSNLNLNVEDGNEYTLTEEDEKNIEIAMDQILDGETQAIFNPNEFNPMMMARGFGKKWWNKRAFVGNVIDAALVVLGIWSSARSVKAAMKIIKANRRNITRVIERQIAKRIGISVGGIISAAIDFVGNLSGYFSIGYLIACGLDWADRRYDGFIFA
ncbi:hypothetical protein [Vagococcus fluvialis]